MPAPIDCVMLTFGQNAHRLFLAQFRSNQPNGRILINANVPVAVVNFCQQLLNALLNVTGNLDKSKPFCDALDLAFVLIQFTNANYDEFHEKMVIMVTDFAQNLSAHFSTLSDEFIRRDIAVAVVAAAILSSSEILENYCALARDTGGEYMLLGNAASVLERVIHSTIHDGYTLREAFYHMTEENNPAAPNDMNEQNETTDGVGELEFDHGLSQ